jgi:hypothetical protein
MSVTFVGVTTNADGTKTWTYVVTELACAQDLSNWVLGTGKCSVVGGAPKLESVNPDPNAQIVGMKWQTGAGFSTGQFSVTTPGSATQGNVQLATKAPGVAYGIVPGPICN